MDKVWKCNHIDAKITELTGDNLEARAKAYLRDELKVEESSIEYFYNIGTEEYVYMDQDRKFGAVEHLLNKKFEVLHLHRDTRHDWGDDGGYIVAICKKDHLFYLHVIEVNYNVELRGLVLDEDDWEKCKDQEGAFKDFLTFNTIEDAQEKIISICDDLDYIIKEDEDVCLWDKDAFDKYEKEYTEYEKDCLRAMMSPYREYSQDKTILHNLIKTTYKPNFTDEDNRELQHSNTALFQKGIIPSKISKKDGKLKLTAERFKEYHAVIEEDLIAPEVNSAKSVAIFIGFCMARHPKMSKHLLNVANEKGLEWKYVQELYKDIDLFYKDVADFVNNTEATKARFNVKLLAVERSIKD